MARAKLRRSFEAATIVFLWGVGSVSSVLALTLGTLWLFFNGHPILGVDAAILGLFLLIMVLAYTTDLNDD